MFPTLKSTGREIGTLSSPLSALVCGKRSLLTQNTTCSGVNPFVMSPLAPMSFNLSNISATSYTPVTASTGNLPLKPLLLIHSNTPKPSTSGICRSNTRRSTPFESIWISFITSLPSLANLTLWPASVRMALSFVRKNTESSARRMFLDVLTIIHASFQKKYILKKEFVKSARLATLYEYYSCFLGFSHVAYLHSGYLEQP